MKLTGKYVADISSSFVEFEVDELPTDEQRAEIKEEQSCYEAIWMGKTTAFGKDGFSLMIGFDDANADDLQLLKIAMSEEDVVEIETMSEKYQ